MWRVIAPYIHEQLGRPQTVLDPAAGRGEFINAVPAAERWAIDLVQYAEGTYAPGVRAIVSDVFDAELPAAHFGGVFVSNFLEHLTAQESVASFLGRMHAAVAPGGRIAIMGPNFRYCAPRVLRHGRSHLDLHPPCDRRAPLRRRFRARSRRASLPAVLVHRSASAVAVAIRYYLKNAAGVEDPGQAVPGHRSLATDPRRMRRRRCDELHRLRRSAASCAQIQAWMSASTSRALCRGRQR